jgi:hypothetical protein
VTTGGIDGNERLTGMMAIALDRLPGSGYRIAALGTALAGGLLLAVETIPLADQWQDAQSRSPRA